MEIHVRYLKEVALNNELELHLQLLDYDSKRLHFVQQMYHKTKGYLAATSEQLTLHVNMTTRSADSFPSIVMHALDAMAETHTALPTPERVGHTIGIKRK